MEINAKSFLRESLSDSLKEAGHTQTLTSLAEEHGSSVQTVTTLLTSTLVSGMIALRQILSGISVKSIHDSVYEALEMGDGELDLVYAAALAMKQEVLNGIDQLVKDLSDS